MNPIFLNPWVIRGAGLATTVGLTAATYYIFPAAASLVAMFSCLASGEAFLPEEDDEDLLPRHLYGGGHTWQAMTVYGVEVLAVQCFLSYQGEYLTLVLNGLASMGLLYFGSKLTTRMHKRFSPGVEAALATANPKYQDRWLIKVPTIIALLILCVGYTVITGVALVHTGESLGQVVTAMAIVAILLALSMVRVLVTQTRDWTDNDLGRRAVLVAMREDVINKEIDNA